MRINRLAYFFLVPFFMLLTAGCREKGCTDPTALNYNPDAVKDDFNCVYGDPNAALKEAVLVHYADLAYAMYSDALLRAVEMQLAIEALISNPAADKMGAARLAWQTAYEQYMHCELFRFANGPIDDERGLAQRLNTWPIAPSYVDYVRTDSFSGIINDPESYPSMSQQALLEAHQLEAPQKASLGFHVIEFLLWGEDDDDAALLTTGSRSYADYLEGESAYANTLRRANFLSAVARQLVTDLNAVTNSWKEGAADREQFLQLDNDRALKYVLSGLATAAVYEFAERSINDPLQSGQILLEPCAFSDLSAAALASGISAYSYLFSGSYANLEGELLEGPALDSLFSVISTPLANDVSGALDLVLSTAGDLPTPMDAFYATEKANAQGPMTTCAAALVDFGTALQNAGDSLGIRVTVTAE